MVRVKKIKRERMKQIFLLGIIVSFISFLYAPIPTSSIITFFIYESPFNAPQEITKLKGKDIAPGGLANKIASSLITQANRGIFVTYGGYLVISDFNGQVSFPRMQQKTDFILIVTEQIKPILMIGNTIHHWEIVPTVPASSYSITKKQDNGTKLFYWEVQSIANPENNIIPLNSIVIFAKSKNIIVPTGITLSNDNPQLILPPVYSVKSNANVIPTLKVLQVRQFFGTLRLDNKKENATYYSSQIVTTQ
jgi:hypothetical protein